MDLREIKLIEKEFLDFEKLNLKIQSPTIADNRRQSPTSKNNFSLKYFTKNFFTKSLKEDFFLEISKDEILEFERNGIFNIKILENINLELNFISKKFTNINLRIIVKENKILNLIDYSNSKNTYKNLEIVLEKNAQLNLSQFVLNSKVNFTKVILFENSIYNLSSVYFAEESNLYLKNTAIHIEKNSKSDLEINGLAKDNSKIINDSKIRIEKKAKKTIGHQKMKNLILDKTSQILSEPILEVENNDVNCSHSSSISQISEQILFYINSRGISKNDAINMIAESYFTKVISAIKDKKVKEVWSKRLEIKRGRG